MYDIVGLIGLIVIFLITIWADYSSKKSEQEFIKQLFESGAVTIKKKMSKERREQILRAIEGLKEEERK